MNLQDYEMVTKLYHKMKEQTGFKANNMMLQHVFEAAIRTKGSDQIAETLEDYVEQGKQPPRFLLQRISSIKDLPDRIYVLLKEHFPNQGAMLQTSRQFT